MLSRLILLIFVASGGISTKGQGVKHVGIFVGTKSTFHFCEIGPRMRLGTRGQVDGPCGLVMGRHTHTEEYNIQINC
jgi:hypothetical protein